MNQTELLLIAIGLAMDACAVSMTNGMCYPKMGRGWVFADGLCFGVMQGLMPLLGFLLGAFFSDFISAFDHYIALIVLSFIGIKMIIEAFRQEEPESGSDMTVPLLLLQGVATSIDAMAVGISFAAMENVSILPACALIALVTAVLSIFSVWLGRRFGKLFHAKAQVLGGVILVGIGVKIFVEHMWFS